MFIILLRLTKDNGHMAEHHFPEHKAWLTQGFDEGVFDLAGRLTDVGGAILARDTTRADIEARIAKDPFVVHGVAQPEILEMSPSVASDAMTHLIPEDAR
ncbi:YciI family protein [Falsiruegeria mediterranea]